MIPLLVLLCLAPPHISSGLGTVFRSHGDPQNPNPHQACTHKDLDDKSLVAAHPSIPCGARLLVCTPRTQQCTTVTVTDRGPAHALIDLSQGAADAMGHNGHENVRFIQLDAGWPSRPAAHKPRRKPEA